MKLSNILLLTLFLGIGSIIFSLKKTQIAKTTSAAKTPVPTLKPAVASTPETSLAHLRLDLSAPKEAGTYGRLSLDNFLATGLPNLTIDNTTQKASADHIIPAEREAKHPSKQDDKRFAHSLEHIEHSIHLGTVELNAAQTTSLPYSPKMDTLQFIDRVAHMAEASPLKPGSRDCGSLKQPNLKTPPKHAKVRSVGMKRQLTDNTSIGVEYVYKDGCYKNAIAPLRSLDMPSDDGVNFRVNMKF